MMEEEEDSRIYDEVQRYLTDGTYPEGAEKPEKAVIRKRSKKFQVVCVHPLYGLALLVNHKYYYCPTCKS